MDRKKDHSSHEATPGSGLPRRPQDETGHGIVRDRTDLEDAVVEPNPPRTTKGKITAPKFGSAGSGGAELEPGPERP
jgi:hypothetical protein